MRNNGYNFDIDAHSDEEELLAKITSDIIDWKQIFNFGRGVEISKSGKIVYCPVCNCAQGYKKKQMDAGEKVCTHCGANILVNAETAHNVVTLSPEPESVLIYVGENIRRYGINGECYIRPNINGINYKNRELYNPPKLLIRKTGLGIYGAIDYTGSMTSQTVYILKYADEDNVTPLEYYLALLNSRVVYYYYLKVYGENEWKSHPYLTKQIIYTLPIRPYAANELDQQIVQLATALMQTYDYQTDLQLEKLIMQKYGLTVEEECLISDEMNRLPDLSGTSEYGITNENVARVVYGDGGHKVRIPSNLSILGTMNTSDQNVFTLDTAFQRRWRMRLIENNFNNVRTSLANAQILDTQITWRNFCETINGIIVSNKAKMASAEDKRLGVYFIHESDLKFDERALPSGEYVTLTVEVDALMKRELLGSITDDEKIRLEQIRDAIIQNRVFPEKVIKYLWDDAFKFNPEALFDTETMESLEQVIRTFVYSMGKDRFNIFKTTVRQLLYPDNQ